MCVFVSIYIHGHVGMHACNAGVHACACTEAKRKKALIPSELELRPLQDDLVLKSEFS